MFSIMMTIRRSDDRLFPRVIRRLQCATLVGIVLFGAGCSMMVDPLVDDMARQSPVVTPSVTAVQEAGKSAVLRRESEVQKQVAAKNGAVTHGPLYFEDGYDENGSDDGMDAWTGGDYRHILVGSGRFLLNAIFFPISAVSMPPFVEMESDGFPSRTVLGERLDARRVDNP